MPRLLRIALLVLAPLILLVISTGWIMEWLWIRQVGYVEIFWILKGTKTALAVAAFMVSAAFLVPNFRMAARRLRSTTLIGTPLQELNISLFEHQGTIRRVLTGLALLLALFFALSFYMQWDASLRFLWNAPFGEVDPVFGRDIGFYLFQLPFWELVQTSLTILVFMTMLVLAVIYALTGQIRVEPREGVLAHPEAAGHLKLNATAWLLLLAWGLFLDRYGLLFRPQGIVFGAGYSDIRIVLPALWITVVLVVLLAGLTFVSRWRRLGKAMVGTAVAVVLVWILGRGIVPAMVQSFNVDPNELELEEPYLENNIAMTRLAYGLDAVEEVDYQANDTLDQSDIVLNRDAIDNIRLWDPRLIIQTYKQLQEIRSYYEFSTVDNDRYLVNGAIKQMLLSAREISRTLPERSDTWVNRHLQFTHGYGLVMSPVTETDRQGEPLLYVRDLPPVYESEELAVQNPAIYYGESGAGYYIVNTETPELDYPDGDDNVYSRYEGAGGIPISNWFRKLLFAWELGDPNILLSDYIRPDSRLQIWRGVQERIRKITPFLQLDADPYLVLAGGRLVWLQDAYTTSRNFPYSQPVSGINYIRNSVKIVVDAYDGSVDYYAVDPEDPVLQVYDAIFPRLLKPFEELPEDIRRHIRYPQDLFEIQLEVFNRYHMTRPQVFYNNEDLWTRPNEQYGGRTIPMEPYYVLARLPGEDDLDFMQISPLTPENRDNMIAWMAAKSSPDEYGRLVVYKLPKQRLIYGPVQIEARIDQNPEISRQLALWDQRGSRVIRGNLMVIPIEDSFIYVEPVFLIAEEVNIPQLQRVIVAVGDGVSMQPTIDQALFELFGEAVAPALAVDEPLPVPEETAPVDTLMRQVVGSEELEEIRSIWRDLRTALENGEWTRYGELMNRLDDAIDEE